MNTTLPQNFIKVVQLVFLLAAVYFLDSDLPLTLFALSASGDSGCGNGGSGDAGGGFGDSGSSGGGGGDTGGGDSGGGSDGVGSSTPFLCVWDGKKYVFENDILFGKPTSRFDSKLVGQRTYENGGIVGDLYKIQTEVVLKDGFASFQIKEIEPEESFIDYLSLVKVSHTKKGTLIPSSDFRDFVVFDNQELKNQTGVETVQLTDNNNTDLRQKINSIDNSVIEHEMQTGDSFVLKAKVTNIDTPLYFVLGSLYRDWTMGEIETLSDISNYAIIRTKLREVWRDSKSVKSFAHGLTSVLGLCIAFTFLWVIVGIQSVISLRTDEKDNQVDYLSQAFGVRVAQADVPSGGGGGGGGGGTGGGGRSLNIEYLNSTGYQLIDVVQPRYYKRNLESVRIPPDAISDNGEVTIRVTATKRHHVTNALLVSPTVLHEVEVSEVPVHKAVNQRTKLDSGHELNDKMSFSYLHTIPGDVVEVDFGPINTKIIDDLETNTSTYLVRAHGFYTSLSAESARKAENWVEKLDSDSKKVLREMYSLRK